MARVYNSILDYVNAVEAALPKAMETYVAPMVSQILKAYITENVYGAYHPKPGGWVHGETYKRSYNLLHGVDAWIEGNELVATSVAAPGESIIGSSVYGGSDGGFLTLLESGNMGIWKNGFPRPVIPQAQEAVDKNIDMFSDILVGGLEKML